MSEEENNFHQQILFDEIPVSANEEQPLKQAIIFNNQDYQDAQEQYAEQEELADNEHKSRWLFTSFIFLAGLLIGFELIDFFIHGFANTPLLTSVYALFLLVVTVALGSFIIKEFSGLRLLKRQEQSRHQAAAILTHEAPLSALQLCQNIHQQLSYDLPQEVEDKWQASVSQALSDEELIQLYDIHVLSKVDDKAIADIAKYSSETMALVAISPLALLDMLIVFWRNIKMIDKIAGLYGLKLGYWSRISLIKQVFANMFLVGASQALIDLGSEALGADLLGKFSGRMAQGFGAGMLTTRLGLATIKVARPLPFLQQVPTLKHVRQSLLNQTKQWLMSKK